MMTDSSPAQPDGPAKIIDAEVVETAAAPAPQPSPALPDPGYDEHGTPSLDHVRAKIESRYATSIGSAELADETAAGRTLAEQEAERARKAKEKLDEIRRSLGRAGTGRPDRAP